MKFFFGAFISFFLLENACAQNVGIGTSTPALTAALDISSTTKGFLPPRMTAAQRALIATSTDGLMVYQTDQPSGFYYIKNGAWVRLTDAPTYPVLNICTQQWMDKNLDITNYLNGDPIPYITDAAVWASLTTGAWCYYNNDPSTAATYGKLYNWYAVNDPRGLAPSGWHIPTDAEWTLLETSCLGGASIAGGKMRVSGITTWQSPNTGATNSSGFAGLPGGYRDVTGAFSGVGIYGGWWSSTAFNAAIAWYRNLVYYAPDIFRDGINKVSGFSVRCIKD
jgi:uncharacterized protein (TIGR02145 family)